MRTKNHFGPELYAKITGGHDEKGTRGAVEGCYIFNALPALQKDDIYMMRSPGRMLSDVANWNLTLIDQNNFWPNDPNYMPSEYCTFADAKRSCMPVNVGK